VTPRLHRGGSGAARQRRSKPGPAVLAPRLPASWSPPGHETLTSVDAAWRGLFYPAVVGAFARPDTMKIFDGGWRWEDFFRGPGVTGLRKGTLTYGPRRRHVCEDGVISDDEWNRRNEARRAAVLEANSTARR
jgi:hypothetical protein